MRSFQHEQLYCIELSKLHKYDITKYNIQQRPFQNCGIRDIGSYIGKALKIDQITLVALIS